MTTGASPPIPPTGRGIQESPPPASRLKDSIVAILNQAGQIAGTGFIVDKRLALTCDHVIVAAGSAAGKSVRLRYEMDGSEVQARVDVKAWSPREQDDVVVLRLESNAPQGAAPLELKP
jgi:hypothetical protein